MNRIILFGTGSGLKDFLSVMPSTNTVMAIADSDEKKHGSHIEGYQVVSPESIDAYDYDYIVITARATDEIRNTLLSRGILTDKIVSFYPSFSQKLHRIVNHDIDILNSALGISVPAIGLATMYLDVQTADGLDQGPSDFVRTQSFRLAARRVADRAVPGAIAELGVFQGDQARVLNRLFSDRTLYLFDTFTGFSKDDLVTEAAGDFSNASAGEFSNTSTDLVMSKMEHPQNVKLRPGFFPSTTEGLDETFAFVSLDVDLYDPTLAGLEWFYKRLNPGGYIFVHDYNNRRYLGVRNAVDRFCDDHGACCVPIPDFGGSVVVTR